MKLTQFFHHLLGLLDDPLCLSVGLVMIGGGHHVMDPVLLHELLEGAALEAGPPVTFQQSGEAQQQGELLQGLCDCGGFC